MTTIISYTILFLVKDKGCSQTYHFFREYSEIVENIVNYSKQWKDATYEWRTFPQAVF